MASCMDEDLPQAPVPLPDSKTAHFFVSYSSDDCQTVFRYVTEIENRFNVKCIFADRDFMPGKDISQNIKESMTNSLRVLLFLSPHFARSGYCKYERELAFVTSMETGENCIIPVLLAPCDIPPTLKTLTYINAGLEGVDVPAKVVDALLNGGADLSSTVDFNVGPKQYENGFCYDLSGVREDLASFRPAKYKFIEDLNLPQKLLDNKIVIPDSLLHRCFEEINKHSVMWSYDYLKRRYVTLWTLIYFTPMIGLIYFFGIVCGQTSVQSRYYHSDDNFPAVYTVFVATLIYGPILIVGTILTIVLLPICCRRKNRDLKVQRELWAKFGSEFIDSRALILFTRRDNLPLVRIMRFDVHKCKDFLVHIIRNKSIPLPDTYTRPEDWTRDLIHSKLRQLIELLADNFEILPDAPYPRHLTKKGKKCLCQMLENEL